MRRPVPADDLGARPLRAAVRRVCRAPRALGRSDAAPASDVGVGVVVNGHMIWCTPKTHQARDVPIPGSLIDALVAGRPAKSPVRPAAATAGSHTRCRQFCEPDGLGVRAAEEDILWLSPHDLRHPAASLAIASGASVKRTAQANGPKKLGLGQMCQRPQHTAPPAGFEPATRGLGNLCSIP